MKKISSKKKVFVISLIAVLVTSVFAVTTTSNGPYYPELTVTKEVRKGSTGVWQDSIIADIGDTVQFRITAAHTGTDYLLYDFYINDTLPSNLVYANNATFNGAPREPDTIEDDTNLSWVIPWSEDAIPPGDQFVIIFNVTVDAAGTAVNVVNVTCTACDDTTKTEEDDATVEVEDIEEPGITVDKQVSLDNDTWVDEVTTDVGSDVYFKVLVTNTGDIELTGVELTDDLPDFLTYNDDANLTPSSSSDHQVVWDLGSLAVDDTVELVFSANADAEGEADNIARARSNEDAIDHDTALVNVTEEEIPGIAVEKYVSIDNSSWLEEVSVGIEDDVYFKILVTNTGDIPFTDVNVSDDLPDFLDYNDDANITAEVDGNQLNWSFTSLAVDEIVEIVFSANATEEGEADNVATAVALCAGIQDDDTARVNVTEEPLPGSMTVEKTVWNETDGWVDEINASINDTVRFKLTVSYTGNYTLYDIIITDFLPVCLDYADNATRTPTNVSADNKTILWNLTDEEEILEDGESLSIEFDALVVSDGTNVNLVNVTATECSGATFYGEDTATVEVAAPPGEMTLEKTVWDDNTSSWVEEINATVGDTVRFNLTVSYHGDYMLYDILITDYLPVCLDYADNATHTPTNVSADNKTVWWNLTDQADVLSDGEQLSIKFDALVTRNGTNVNLVNVTTNECSGIIMYAEDTATVIVEEEEPDVVVEKTIWDDNLDRWVDEINTVFLTNVRFNITVSNNGDSIVYNLTVTDMLPDILTYVDGSATIEPYSVSADKRTIVWKKAALDAGHSWSVEFTARVVSCNPPVSGVNVVNVSSHVCGGELGYTTDEARVNVVTDAVKPQSYVNDVGWHQTTPINITAEAEDDVNGTGVARVVLYYRFHDGSEWTNWTSFGIDSDSADDWSWEFNFTEGEGTYEFYSLAADQAGNKEVEKDTADAVGGYDLTPPSSSSSLSGTSSNGWYNSVVTVTLSATDALSGIDTIYYKLDGGSTRTYSSPFDVTGTGQHEVEYWSEDNAGNTETPSNTRSFKVDIEDPIMGISRPEKGYRYYFDTLRFRRLLGDTPLIRGAITIQVNATDVGSGVDKVEFYIDDDLQAEDTSSPYEWKWTPPFSVLFRSHEIKVTVYDNAGNLRTDLLTVKTKRLLPGGGSGNETQSQPTSNSVSTHQTTAAQQTAVTTSTHSTSQASISQASVADTSEKTLCATRTLR